MGAHRLAIGVSLTPEPIREPPLDGQGVSTWSKMPNPLLRLGGQV